MFDSQTPPWINPQMVAIEQTCVHALAQLQESLWFLFRDFGRDTLPDQTLEALCKYAIQRSDAVSRLVAINCVWDAEIILRSFYESIMKTVFIATVERNMIEDIAREYWIDVADVSDRRRARKAKMAEEFAASSGHNFDADVFRLLRDKDLFPESPHSSKKSRKQIEKRWSFAGMIEELKNRDIALLNNAEVFLHQYGLASHLIHADHGAIEFMIDRSTREPSELILLQRSHICRIYSDQVSLMMWVSFVLDTYFDNKLSNRAAIVENFQRMSEMTSQVHQQFEISQRDFYDRHLRKKAAE